MYFSVGQMFSGQNVRSLKKRAEVTRLQTVRVIKFEFWQVHISGT